MKNGTKKTEANTLRQRADEAVARWQPVNAAYEAACAAHAAFEEQTTAVRRITDVRFEDTKARFARKDAEIRLLELEIQAAEAGGRATIAQHEATRALDAAERAEGSELAIACDLAALRDALVADAEEIARLDEEVNAVTARLKAAIAEVEHRRENRPAALSAAREKLAERRRAAGLPPPQRLPDVTSGAMLSALDETIAAAPPVANPRRTLIMQEKVDELRAAREVERRKIEEAEADAAWRANERAEAQRLAGEEDRAAWQAKLAAERAERDALVAADRERAAE